MVRRWNKYIAGNIAVSYDFNYKKEDWNWDNKLLLDYGLTKIKNDDFTKKQMIDWNLIPIRKKSWEKLVLFGISKLSHTNNQRI